MASNNPVRMARAELSRLQDLGTHTAAWVWVTSQQ